MPGLTLIKAVKTGLSHARGGSECELEAAAMTDSKLTISGRSLPLESVFSMVSCGEHTLS